MRNRGRPKGPGPLFSLDVALFKAIEDLIAESVARTPEAAARVLAERGLVAGAGTVANRARRLARRYRDFMCATNPSPPTAKQRSSSGMTTDTIIRQLRTELCWTQGQMSQLTRTVRALQERLDQHTGAIVDMHAVQKRMVGMLDNIAARGDPAAATLH